MNAILSLSIMLFFSTFSLAQLIQWEPEIIVADGAVYGNGRPRATLVGNDPVVLFGKPGVDENLFIARWNGSGFNTPVAILPSSTSSYLTEWTGPDLDSYGNTLIATFKLEPLEVGKVYSVRSTDGGQTFSDTIRVDDHPQGVAWMPSMAMDMNGNPIVTYMAHDAAWTNPRYVVVRSTDGGLTYGAEIDVTSAITPEVCDCCPAELAVNGNKTALLFRNNESNIRDIYAASSNDGGSTFPFYDNLDELNWSIAACPSTGADGCYANNRLLTAFASAASGKYRVYVSASTVDGPIGFEDRMQVPEPDLPNGSQNYPRISAAGDTLVMAWKESVFGNQEIFCSISLPGLNPLLALSSYKQQSNETTAGLQTNPEVIYKNGFVHLFYQDNGGGNLIYRRGVISTSLGLDEAASSLSVYPNPNEGSFYMASNLGNLSLMDGMGRAIPFTRVAEGERMHISLTNVVSGIYFLNATHDGHPMSTRIFIR